MDAKALPPASDCIKTKNIALRIGWMIFFKDRYPNNASKLNSF
jgi:hypothetical protein